MTAIMVIKSGKSQRASSTQAFGWKTTSSSGVWSSTTREDIYLLTALVVTPAVKVTLPMMNLPPQKSATYDLLRPGLPVRFVKLLKGFSCVKFSLGGPTLRPKFLVPEKILGVGGLLVSTLLV